MYICILYVRCEADVLNADDLAGGDCGVEGEEVCVCIYTERERRSESVCECIQRERRSVCVYIQKEK
jgi:hypothetical protein